MSARIRPYRPRRAPERPLPMTEDEVAAMERQAREDALRQAHERGRRAMLYQQERTLLHEARRAAHERLYPPVLP